MKKRLDRRRATKLTPKQLRFVYEFCTKTLMGLQSGSESARKAGYSEAIARKSAYELQDPNKYPLVAEAIYDMKKEQQNKYSVNMDKHVARLDDLGKRAEEEKHFAAAINAEALRGKAGGLYDPTIKMQSAIENLPREELIKQLSELQKKGIPVVGEENVIEYEPSDDESDDEVKLIEHEKIKTESQGETPQTPDTETGSKPHHG
jgi:hypothetical protein|tara:strand:- start:3710 stop:4324 length:615 start_codon:yes stop_codon:yes gene_type:complete